LEALTCSDAVAADAQAPSMQHAVSRAAGGDPLARDAIARAGAWIGLGLANLATLLAPDAIVIGGGVAAAGELLLGPLREQLSARSPLVPRGTVGVHVGELGTFAGAVGAALAARDASR